LDSFWNRSDGTGKEFTTFLWERPESLEDFQEYVTFLQGQGQGQDQQEEENVLMGDVTPVQTPRRRKGSLPLLPHILSTPSPTRYRAPAPAPAPEEGSSQRLKVPRPYELYEGEENNTTGGSITRKKRKHPKRSNRRKYNNRTTYKRRKSQY
jgi:hypothetical protein